MFTVVSRGKKTATIVNKQNMAEIEYTGVGKGDEACYGKGDKSHPTLGIALFGSNVSERLRSSRE